MATPPSLVAYTETVWTGSGSKNTAAQITWQAGDLIIVIGGTEGPASPAAPTCTGLVFSAVTGCAVASGTNCYGNAWAATPSGGGGPQYVAGTGNGSNRWGFGVWQWRAHGGTGGAIGTASATTPHTLLTAQITKATANCCVCGALFDYSAAVTTNYAWTPTIGNSRQANRNNPYYTYYVGDWGDQGSAGAASFGISGVGSSGPFTKFAVEIRSTTSPDATVTMTGSLAAPAAVPAPVVRQDRTVTLSAALAATCALPAAAVTVPQTSPALELSGFGAATGIGASDTVEWVRVAVAQFQSSAAMDAPLIELWDGATARIGAAQAGTHTTTSSNTDTFTFTGVTYAQLAGLRVRVYARQGTATPGAAQSVDAAGVTVCYSVSDAGGTPATVTMAGFLTVGGTRPAPSVTATSNAAAAPATLTASTTQPAATVTATSNAAVTMGAALAAPATLPAAAASSNAAASPAVLAGAVTQPGAAASSNAAASPAPLAAAGAVPAVSVTAVCNATASPAPLAATTGLPVPGVVAGGNATITMSAALAAVTALPAPVVEQDAAITAAVLAGAVTVPAATASSNAAATPAALAATATVPAPAASANATAGPAVLAAATTLPAPAAAGGATAAPAALAATLAQPAAAAGAGMTAAAQPPAAPAAFPDPAVLAGGSATAAPAVLAAVAGWPAPYAATYPQVSPALELSGFGTFTGITPGDTINSVTVTLTEHQSDAAMGPVTFELRDGTDTRIGDTQTGTASTIPGHTTTATFTGVTYAQLATLRVLAWGNSGAATAGAAQYVDAVSLAVAYTHAAGAEATPATVTATAGFPAPSLAVTAEPAPLAATTAIPVPQVTVPASVLVASSPGYPSMPGLARPGRFTPGGSQQGFTLGLTAAARFPAVTVSTVGARASAPGYASAYATPVPGIGTWASPAQAEGEPDGLVASWSVV